LLPLILIAFGVRLAAQRAGAAPPTDASRYNLDARVREITAEIERNHAQLADMRIEQVTEKERKRIAADLHDDLGAKLLTIVHTSESERISTLAREALEEMRLSVRGLTGRPVRLSDALADWRAETVMRLGQANIEIDWKNLAEDTDQVLPAVRAEHPGQRQGHPDGARRQARPRPRHVEHETPRQADAGPVPRRVRAGLWHRDKAHVAPGPRGPRGPLALIGSPCGCICAPSEDSP
jgi:hypothetical protein